MINFFRRRYLISLLYLLICTIGIATWLDIPTELTPELNLPTITVSYRWGSSSPEVMELEITRKVEGIANRLRDVRKVRSITREGRSSVTIEFAPNAPVEFRVIELQELLYGLRADLPASLSLPSINRSVPREIQDAQTFMMYSVIADIPARELLAIAEKRIQSKLLGLDGVSDVELRGVNRPAINLMFNTPLMEQLGIQVRSVSSEIVQELGWHSAGFAEYSDHRLSIMVPPQMKSIEEIRRLKLKIPNSERVIQLSDIADVQVTDYPEKSMKRINGVSALSLEIVKEPGSDAMKLAEQVIDLMAEIQAELPGEIILKLERDSTEELRKQLSELQLQSFYSLACVFFVLLIFIRRLRAPFIILGSIFFSLLLSVFVLYLMEYTLNLITLAGLTVALGMIIDNAVVVFEQVNPGLPETREDRLNHLKELLPRAVVPVIGATLTTIGIFVPLLFSIESLRAFLIPLAIALSSTLVASVFVSLTWIPYALTWLVAPAEKGQFGKKERSWSSRARSIILRLFLWRHKTRWVFYFLIFAVIGLPLWAIKEPKWSSEESLLKTIASPYFQGRESIDPYIGGLTYYFQKGARFGQRWGGPTHESIRVGITAPQGTPLDELNKIATNFELIANPFLECLEYFETQIDEQSSSARLNFVIKNDYLLRPDPYILYANAAYLGARTGNVSISVSGLGDSFYSGFGGGSSSRSITFKGFSYDDLLEAAQRLEAILSKNPRVRDIDIHGTSTWGSRDLFQYKLKLDGDQLIQKNMRRGEVIDALQVEMNPTNTLGTVELDGESYYLLATSQESGGYWEDFRDKKRKSNRAMFSVDEVAAFDKERVMNMIQRENQSYTRVVKFDFLGPPRFAENFQKALIESFPLPVGTSISSNYDYFSFQREENTALVWVLLMSILSVWMIVSALLESWRDPAIVILTVPFALIGVMAGVLYMDINVDRGAIAGTLLSIGVVVNNAILLIHEKQRLRAEGIHGFRSWYYVYRTKIRAVLITTLTTIGGLIPLMLFGTQDFWKDMATVVVWALSFSTLLVMMFMGMWEKQPKLMPSPVLEPPSEKGPD